MACAQERFCLELIHAVLKIRAVNQGIGLWGNARTAGQQVRIEQLAQLKMRVAFHHDLCCLQGLGKKSSREQLVSFQKQCLATVVVHWALMAVRLWITLTGGMQQIQGDRIRRQGLRGVDDFPRQFRNVLATVQLHPRSPLRDLSQHILALQPQPDA